MDHSSDNILCLAIAKIFFFFFILLAFYNKMSSEEGVTAQLWRRGTELVLTLLADPTTQRARIIHG